MRSRRAKINILILALDELDKARRFMVRDGLEADAFRCWIACANVEAAAEALTTRTANR